MGAARCLAAAAAAGGTLVAPRGAAGMEREGHREWLQEHLAGKEKLKCPSTKPLLKDQMNHLTVPKLAHADRNKKDVLRNMVKGDSGDGKLSTRSTQHTGHTALKSSNMSQRAVVPHPEQPRKSTKLLTGLMPSVSSCHSVQPRGRLPPSTSGHLHPERNKEPGHGTVTAAAPPSESDPPPPGAPCCPHEGLQDRLLCNKENIQAQASMQPVLNRVFQSDGNSPGKKKVLSHRQNSTMVSRSIAGPRDRSNGHQSKEEPVQDKFRKTLTGSKSTNIKTQPLQPPRSLAASACLPDKKTGANQEKTNMAKPPIRRPPAVPVGSLKQHSRPPQVERSPTKPLASRRPQGTTNMTSSLKPGGPVQGKRPVAKGEVGRKDTKLMPPRHTAASQVVVTQKQPCGTQGSKTQVFKSDLRSRNERLKPELPKASGMFPRRVPKTPSAADRKKQLEEWLASKGKTYKRPPMMLLQKNPVKLSCRNVKEKEKGEKPEQQSLEKINEILTECLKLVEEGAQAEELSAVLSCVPHAEKFAKFWICKAKLLSRDGPFDVTGLYRAAVCAGAVPLQELREVVLDILKATDQTSEGEKAEQPIPWDPTTPCPSETQKTAVTPCVPKSSLTSLPASIKLQVTSAPRGKGLLEGQELKLVTPVRRSLRIGRVGSRYPEMLKDHDPVVSSLSEILDAEEETRFFFRKNKALPEVAELEGVSLCPPECC